MIRFLLGCSVLLVGCSSNTYPLGFTFTSLLEMEQSTSSFRIVNDTDVLESVGIVGSGETQSLASSSAGSRTVSSFGQLQTISTVVGETYLSHPLVPNDDTFDKIPASVVQERVRMASYSIVDEEFFDPTFSPPQYSLLSYSDDAITTKAGFYAVAADEYVVRFDLGTLWEDFGEDVSLGDVELMTRNKPSEGDVWASENGNTLFIYSGESALNIAGQGQKVDKIELFEATDLQANGKDVYTQCFSFGLSQVDSQDSETIVDSSIETMLLDAGCASAFTHVKVGTQYWYKNVLVKEESTRLSIEIKDYGYEWYEEESPNVWTRILSNSKGNDSALPYVEYELTESVETLSIVKWVEP